MSDIEGRDWGFEGAQARRDDFKRWEMHKMTKQQEEAIAKFLGVKLKNNVFNSDWDKLIVINGRRVLFAHWLSGDSGTVAMIEKLIHGGGYTVLDTNTTSTFIKKDNVCESAPTLNTALQAAILEVIKDDSK